jgi:hypothetical protein
MRKAAITGRRQLRWSTIVSALRNRLVGVLFPGRAQTRCLSGVLVYVASRSAPSELVVRDPAGRTIATENLGRRKRGSNRNLRRRSRIVSRSPPLDATPNSAPRKFADGATILLSDIFARPRRDQRLRLDIAYCLHIE